MTERGMVEGREALLFESIALRRLRTRLCIETTPLLRKGRSDGPTDGGHAGMVHCRVGVRESCK